MTFYLIIIGLIMTVGYINLDLFPHNYDLVCQLRLFNLNNLIKSMILVIILTFMTFYIIIITFYYYDSP